MGLRASGREEVLRGAQVDEEGSDGGFTEPCSQCVARRLEAVCPIARRVSIARGIVDELVDGETAPLESGPQVAGRDARGRTRPNVASEERSERQRLRLRAEVGIEPGIRRRPPSELAHHTAVVGHVLEATEAGDGRKPPTRGCREKVGELYGARQALARNQGTDKLELLARGREPVHANAAAPGVVEEAAPPRPDVEHVGTSPQSEGVDDEP